jgi:hypothetical protein
MNSIRIISRLSAVLVVLAVAILLAAYGLARAPSEGVAHSQWPRL